MQQNILQNKNVSVEGERQEVEDRCFETGLGGQETGKEIEGLSTAKRKVKKRRGKEGKHSKLTVVKTIS